MTKNKKIYKVSKIRMLIYTALTIGSALYALPNFYEKVPSVVLVPKNVDTETLSVDKVENLLKNNSIKYDFIKNKNNDIQIGFDNINSQMKGYEKIQTSLHDKNYYTNITTVSAQPDWLTSLHAKSASLGLDLMGGVHFLMEVDTKDLKDKTFVKYSKNIQALNPDIKIVLNDNIMTISNFTTADNKKIEQDYSTIFDIKKSENGKDLILKFNKEYLKNVTDLAVKQNVLTLKNRVNELGVAEPVVQREGTDRIVIQLPGIQDTQKAKGIIGTTATLEFRAVKADGIKDKNSEYIPMMDTLNPVLFKKDAIISGDSIIDASSGFDPQSNSPLVSVVLDSDAGDTMLNYTSKNKGSFMGSVLHETTYSTTKDDKGNNVKEKHVNTKAINVARIQGVFSNRFQITGLDDKDESHKLAILLRSGSLAAPVDIIEEKTIGPNMGAENIAKGTRSIIFGFFLVLVVMFARYRSFGLVANFCVSINLLLLLATLSFIGATLTLPGIAGIILTVGMAVDGNVIIFERIKEEYLKTGKVKKSIDAGYSKASATIIDANITTLIASFVLFAVGSGPIKGFAVTLTLGIITSMITSIFLSKFIMDLFFVNKDTLNFKTAISEVK